MTNLRLIAAMAGVALLPGAHAAGNGYTVTNCAEAMNKARTEAHLPNLTAATQQTLVLPHWRSVPNAEFCAALESGKHPGGQLSNEDVTLAIAIQTGDSPDCAAAVKQWQAGYSFFGGKIPPKFQGYTAPYDSIQSVSFVALYTPKSSPKVECAYVHCDSTTAGGSLGASAGASATQSVQQTVVATPANQPEVASIPATQSVQQPVVAIPANQTEVAAIPVVAAEPAVAVVSPGGARRLSTSSGFYALTCGVAPGALENGKAPFTEDEWEKISSVLSSATPLQVPTLFVLLSLVFCSYFL